MRQKDKLNWLSKHNSISKMEGNTTFMVLKENIRCQPNIIYLDFKKVGEVKTFLNQ